MIKFAMQKHKFVIILIRKSSKNIRMISIDVSPNDMLTRAYFLEITCSIL